MRDWIKIPKNTYNHADAPPVFGPHWFASAGNTRNPQPHVKLASPAMENCSDSFYWMPYQDGDEEPSLPDMPEYRIAKNAE